MAKQLLALIDIKEGMEARIKSITCDEGVKHRLCSLGILKGKIVKVIKNDSSSPILIKVLDSKIAVGRDQAKNIFIDEDVSI